ncbi:unnamed protein product [Owenia fusiformis]|uniref:Uncharacterized protein n=1 Tax=Owenia fusiformis TaxID=6347 RepID=A0A8J1UPB5_OWEFU|nr:unnamed protein product [Owenia fusiformis]
MSLTVLLSNLNLTPDLNNVTMMGFMNNYTGLLQMIQNLDDDEKNQLMQELGVSLDEIYEWIKPPDEKNPEDELVFFWEYRAYKSLYLIVPPLLVILGSVGNIMSFIILRHRYMIRLSTYFYLAVLSIVDTFVLYIGLLRKWISYLTGTDLANMAGWSCKLLQAFGYVASDFAVWLIIAVTVERFIVVCYPLRAATMCNIPRAKRVILGIFFLIFFINLHFFITVDVTKGTCDAAPAFKTLVTDIWPWVDAAIYSFVPFLLITILNTMIIAQVIVARRSRNNMATRGGSMASNGKEKPTHEKSAKLTVMLLTVSFTFLVLTLPINVAMIAMASWSKHQDDKHMYSRFLLVRFTTELLMYTNHSINFFLYCATGQKFRQQILRIICRRNIYQGGARSDFHSHNTNMTSMKKGSSYRNGKFPDIAPRIVGINNPPLREAHTRLILKQQSSDYSNTTDADV